MVKTIVFDFGKVVSFFDHRLVSRRLAAWTDVPEPDLFAYLFGGPLEDAYESGRLGTDAFLDTVHAECRLRCTRDELARAYADIFWPNADVCALLPRLAGRHRLLLLSNTNELHARQFLPQYRETLAAFDALVLSHEVGHRKPKREVFEHCQRLAHCAPGECLFIDDLPANVEGARAFGWQGLVYHDAERLRRDLAGCGILTP
jgi:putative hydrolase of the HAD superfamily